MRRSLLLAALLLIVPTAQAAPYYESGTMGATNQNGGDFLGNSQFIGARFIVSSPVTIDRIGGHIGRSTTSTASEQLFGVICQLSGMSDMPDSLNLSTPDILAVTLFTPPLASNDLAIPITPVTLGPGTYGVLFGSGLFGATARGFIPFNSTNVGLPSFFWRDSVPQWRNGGLPPGRLTVYEVGAPAPEPATLALLATAGLPALRRRR